MLPQREPHNLYSHVALHALGWLCAANLAGLVLALMLLVPAVNEVTAPFTYGRLIPVHLNGQLYGWCFIPLIGILYVWYVGSSRCSRGPRMAVDIWSISIGAGCLYWLSGQTSGKLFMEWSGGARWLLAANMMFLALVLLRQLVREPGPRGTGRLLKWIVWLSLLPVPFVMFKTADPSIYPSVNPDSGGATGSNLLISTLGLVTILWITPFVFRLRHHVGRGSLILYAVAQVLHYGLFALLGHGDRSNHETAQVLGLATLMIWVPLLIRHYRRFEWPAEARPWLWSFALWAAFLAVTANIMFAPGLLDRWKFTNFIVGHTHAAMAGMLSGFNMLVLITINPSGSARRVLGSLPLCIAWNAGTGLHVAVLKLFGMLEGRHVDWLYTRPDLTGAAYGLRLASGLAMFTVGMLWLFRLLHVSGDAVNEKE